MLISSGLTVTIYVFVKDGHLDVDGLQVISADMAWRPTDGLRPREL